MKVTAFTRIDEIHPLMTVWDQLACHPMLTATWQLTWWENYFGRDSSMLQLYVLCVFDDADRVVGIAPFYLRKDMFGQRTLSFLGDGKVCSDHLTIIAADGWDDKVAIAIAKHLATHRHEWDRMLLDSVDADDPQLELFAREMESAGFSQQRRVKESSWRLTLPSSWDEYLSLLSKSHRKRCRRLQRIYFDSGRAVVRHVENQEQLSVGLDVLHQLHAERWSSAGHGGEFTSVAFSSFHRTIAHQFLERGMLRLAWLELDGEPVAVEYQFGSNGILYAYQSGAAPARKADQPGNLSIMATIQDGIELGYDAIDFMRGDEPYKAHWRAQPTPCHDLCIWQGSIRGQLQHRVSLARETAKQWFRKGQEIIQSR